MDKIKLKPCGFCGGEGHIYGRYTKKAHRMYYAVRCKRKCHKVARYFTSPEIAAKAWNGDDEKEAPNDTLN